MAVSVVFYVSRKKPRKLKERFTLLFSPKKQEQVLNYSLSGKDFYISRSMGGGKGVCYMLSFPLLLTRRDTAQAPQHNNGLSCHVQIDMS